MGRSGTGGEASPSQRISISEFFLKTFLTLSFSNILSEYILKHFQPWIIFQLIVSISGQSHLFQIGDPTLPPLTAPEKAIFLQSRLQEKESGNKFAATTVKAAPATDHYILRAKEDHIGKSELHAPEDHFAQSYMEILFSPYSLFCCRE